MTSSIRIFEKIKLPSKTTYFRVPQGQTSRYDRLAQTPKRQFKVTQWSLGVKLPYWGLEPYGGPNYEVPSRYHQNITRYPVSNVNFHFPWDHISAENIANSYENVIAGQERTLIGQVDEFSFPMVQITKILDSKLVT